jgi:hypothetical protein
LPGEDQLKKSRQQLTRPLKKGTDTLATTPNRGDSLIAPRASPLFQQSVTGRAEPRALLFARGDGIGKAAGLFSENWQLSIQTALPTKSRELNGRSRSDFFNGLLRKIGVAGLNEAKTIERQLGTAGC